MNSILLGEEHGSDLPRFGSLRNLRGRETSGYEPLVPNGTRTPESGTERDAYSAMDIDA